MTPVSKQTPRKARTYFAWIIYNGAKRNTPAFIFREGPGAKCREDFYDFVTVRRVKVTEVLPKRARPSSEVPRP